MCGRTDGVLVMSYSVRPSLSSFGAFTRRGAETKFGNSGKSSTTADIVEISAVARLAGRKDGRQDEGLPYLLRRGMIAPAGAGTHGKAAVVIALDGQDGSRPGAGIDRKV